MRRENIREGAFYHIVNRGSDAKTLYYDKGDLARFLFLIIYGQSKVSFRNIGRNVNRFLVRGSFDISSEILEEISQTRQVELVNFCIMPNHFHLTIYNRTEQGISSYMQRIQNAYAKYFNTRYNKRGHVFEGAYTAVTIHNDTELQHLSTYIHKNPQGLTKWNGIYHLYPWSSLPDYIEDNRWGDLLLMDPILTGFDTPHEYKNFVEETSLHEFDF